MTGFAFETALQPATVNRPSRVRRALWAAARWLDGKLVAVEAARQTRQTQRMLRDLDPRILDDIGLRHHALHRPDVDPSHLLRGGW